MSEAYDAMVNKDGDTYYYTALSDVELAKAHHSWENPYKPEQLAFTTSVKEDALPGLTGESEKTLASLKLDDMLVFGTPGDTTEYFNFESILSTQQPKTIVILGREDEGVVNIGFSSKSMDSSLLGQWDPDIEFVGGLQVNQQLNDKMEYIQIEEDKTFIGFYGIVRKLKPLLSGEGLAGIIGLPGSGDLIDSTLNLGGDT